MIKIYQTIKGENGNCLQAATASLFNLSLSEVPDFQGERQDSDHRAFLNRLGYEIKETLWSRNWNILNTTFKRYCFNGVQMCEKLELNKQNLRKYKPIGGAYLATVLSPGRGSVVNQQYHAVLIDKDFNIIHDPNDSYENILNYPLAELLGNNGVCYVDIIDKI